MSYALASDAGPLMIVSHTEESAVTYQKTPKRDTSIRDTVNKLVKLSPVAKAILTEAVELHMKGGKEQCYATNEQLAAAAHCHEKSVSRHLRQLEELGLVKMEYPKRDNRFRMIIPSDEVLEACATGNTDPCNQVLQALVTRCYEASNRVLPPSPPDVTLLHTTTSNSNSRVSASSLSASADLKDKCNRIEEQSQEIKVLKAEVEKAMLPEQIWQALKACTSEAEILAVWHDLAEKPGKDTLAYELFRLRKNDLTTQPQAKPLKRASSTARPAVGHQKLQEVFEEWFKGTTGAPPDTNTADWTATAKLYKYLLKGNNQNEGMALDTFRSILAKWNTYDRITRENPTLRYIGANINKIITQHQHGQPKQPTRPGLVNNADVSANLRELKEMGLI